MTKEFLRNEKVKHEKCLYQEYEGRELKNKGVEVDIDLLPLLLLFLVVFHILTLLIIISTLHLFLRDVSVLLYHVIL